MITVSTAASPILIPCLLRWNGRHLSEESTPRDLKPAAVTRETELTPPAMTASAIPASMSPAAEMSARADEVQAVAADQQGPFIPRVSRT